MTQGNAREVSVAPARRRVVRRRLLGWFDRHRRDLPWRRRSGDPYAQWVAEVMLQQTRVETVLRYYEPFLRRFPNVAALARASGVQLKRVWQGLGYYRRADHLHQAARQLVERDGVLPNTIGGLRSLPGVGRYTAAAVASIAFGVRAAAVDGNVARVLARLFAVRGEVTDRVTLDAIQFIADQLVPRGRPGDFNQAWMDLGSMVCTPRSPDCPACPLRSICLAHRMELTEELPNRRRAAAPAIMRRVALAAVGANGAFVLARRPDGGLWSGLWELPSFDHDPRRPVEAQLAEWLIGQALDSRHRPRFVAQATDRLTHRLVQTELYVVEVGGRNNGKFDDAVHRWASSAQLRSLPMSAATRKLLRLVPGR